MAPIKNKFITVFVYYLTLLALFTSTLTHATPSNKTLATISTSMGDMKLELFTSKAPTTVANFIAYAESGFFTGTIFHRVIPSFMIQGGGFNTDFAKKTTQPPIKNESNPFVPNRRGTIAMARTSAPDSATSQFFINVVDNKSLNKTASSDGYAVFGKIIEGMIVADQISSVKTGIQNRMRDVPTQPIIIHSITITHPVTDETKKNKTKRHQ